MSMKKLLALPLTLTAAFALAGCGDPNAPPRHLDAPAPDWAQNLEVPYISKYSAVAVNARGQSVRVSRGGTDLGNGLTGTRDFYDLYVTDGTVTCNWNSGERLEWCRQPNPAYTAYRAAREAARAAKP